jgi:hypothetical protein
VAQVRGAPALGVTTLPPSLGRRYHQSLDVNGLSAGAVNRELPGARQQYSARDVLLDAERMDGVLRETWIVSIQTNSKLRLHVPTLHEVPTIKPEVLGRTTALLRWLERCVRRLHGRADAPPVTGSFVMTVNLRWFPAAENFSNQQFAEIGIF